MRRARTARKPRKGRSAPSGTPSGVRLLYSNAGAGEAAPEAGREEKRDKKRSLAQASGDGAGQTARKRARAKRSRSGASTKAQAMSVFVRVKNEAAGDRACASDAACIHVHDNGTTLELLATSDEAQGSGRGRMKTARPAKTYTLDGVFPSTSTQSDVFDRVGVPLLDACFKGFNGTILAYGQTGSGKTYTMLGDPLSKEVKGVTPRVVAQLYERIEAERVAALARGKVFSCTVSCSMVEVYNERVFDLLAKGKPKTRERTLRQHGDSKEVFVEGVEKATIANVADALRQLTAGDAQRHVGATQANKESSRSHSVYTLWCTMSWGTAASSDAAALSDVREVTAKLNLVDLAGSESAKYTGATGVRMKEGNNINQSLSQLGNVVRR